MAWRLSSEKRQHWQQEILREDKYANGWMEQNRSELPPEELKMGEVVPASGAAEPFLGCVQQCRNAVVWEGLKQREQQVRTYVNPYALQPKLAAALRLRFSNMDVPRIRSWHLWSCQPPHYIKGTNSEPSIRTIPADSVDGSVRDSSKKHARAEHEAVELTHTCDADCQCKDDWRPFIHWRPWQNPSDDVVSDWEAKFSVDGGTPLGLSVTLQRILKVHRATYPFWTPYKEKPIFFQRRVNAHRRRLQLRSWVNGQEQPPKYAKAYECWDFKARRSGEKDTKWKVNLDYTIVTREKPREKSTKIPGYKKHDGWREVMSYLGCSRRTAFRKIKNGYRIPKADAHSK